MVHIILVPALYEPPQPIRHFYVNGIITGSSPLQQHKNHVGKEGATTSILLIAGNSKYSGKHLVRSIRRRASGASAVFVQQKANTTTTYTAAAAAQETKCRRGRPKLPRKRRGKHFFSFFSSWTRINNTPQKPRPILRTRTRLSRPISRTRARLSVSIPREREQGYPIIPKVLPVKKTDHYKTVHAFLFLSPGRASLRVARASLKALARAAHLANQNQLILYTISSRQTDTRHAHALSSIYNSFNIIRYNGRK